MKDSVDWESFLRPMDMVWRRLPDAWDNGPFLGNGTVGVVVRKGGDRELLWEVGRADIEEHRRPLDPDADQALDHCRYAPGTFVLKTAGKITGCDLRLDLWNAELRGTVMTEAGEIAVRTFIPARGPMVVVADIAPDEGEAAAEWSWTAYEAISPRIVMGWATLTPDYRRNPAPVTTAHGVDNVCIQELEHGATATAWRVVEGAGSRRLVAGIAHTYPAKDAEDRALSSVAEAVAAGDEVLSEAHRAWWHAWYPGSFLSLSDDYWTAFYWAQLYKMASATRPDGVVLDIQGPWAQRSTAWPANWTNLNLQLTYWPAYVGNRLDLAESLRVNMARHRDNLIANVPEQYRGDSAGIGRVSGLNLSSRVAEPGKDEDAEVGSLLWLCHNLWWHYRMTMDDGMLRDEVYPILRRAVNYHLHFLRREEDGRFHLPSMHSPEYGAAADCNYDLALLRWGCRTLLWIDARLGLEDPLVAKWRAVDADLVDYPKDEHGYMIGAGQPFARSHRHFSHLFMIWPMRLVDADDPETRDLAEQSVRWWLSKEEALAGFSFTGGASLLAVLGDADGAYAVLNGMKQFVGPNTMYHEYGNPVIETSLSANQSIHDMLLQSSGDEISVFAATPSAWTDAVFRDWRGEGAFLVSAERKGGETRWISVTSLAGEPLKLRARFGSGPEISGTDRVKTVLGGWDAALKPGETLLLTAPGVVPEVKPVSDGETANPFGMKERLGGDR